MGVIFMSLKIVCGRSGSGKSTYLLNDMSDENNVIYIVPEQFSFTAEKMLIKKFGMVGLGKPQVLSFMRLADNVFSKYGSPEFITDNASFEMLVSYCANSVKPENLNLFNGLVKKSELAQTASDVIKTFKTYRITTEQISYAINKTEDELLKKKLKDSLVIYEAYSQEIADAGIADTHDKLSVLADILSDTGCDFLADKHIFIDQFTDFDPSEFACITQMMKYAKSVTVALCTDGSEQFETVNRTLKRLNDIAKQNNIKQIPTVELSDSMISASPMLRHLEKCYFEDDTPKFAGNDGTISVFCGKNRFSEIHNIAKEITRLVRDCNMRYRDISVVARDSETYKGLIDRIFPFYDIPVFADRKIALSGHSIAMYISSILEIALGGFTYENVFAYIKSPFSPLTESEADILENYCLATGVNAYSWKKPFTYKSSVYRGESSFARDEYTLEMMEYINELREKVFLPLDTLIKNLKKDCDVSTLCGYLFDFLEESDIETKIYNRAQMLEAQGENLHALQTVQVYNILVDIFNDICNVLGKKTLTLKEFRTTIQAGLQAVEIGTIPSSSDCITLGSIDRIKGHGAKAVFLIGANSGIFPSYPTENGLFSDSDKHEMESLGIEMPPNLLQLTQSEQLLIYDALTCADERLYISYANADSSSQAMLPSEIVERILSVFPDITFTDDIKENNDSFVSTKKAMFDLLCAELREYNSNGKPLSDTMSAAAYYFSKDETYSPLLEQALEMTQYTNSTKRIYPNLIDDVIGGDMQTSITRLEAYNKCPFSFFAKYLLKLEPKKMFEIKTSDSGSFLHDFLDRFSQFIADSKDSCGKALTWKTIDDDFIKLNTPIILREILTGVNSFMLDTPRIKALFDRLCKTAEQSVYAVRHHIIKSDFMPMGYELSFDENGNFKPINITLPDGKKIVLRGRIDRADEFTAKLPDGTEAKFVRIVDYKSTDKALSLSDVYHGVQLQLFVYLSTLCDNGYSPAGILYCNLSDPIVNVKPGDTEDVIMEKRLSERRMEGIVLSEYEMLDHMGGKDILKSNKTASTKNFNSMFRHISKVIKNTAQNIYSGKFPIKCTPDACTWCEYAQLCRFDGAFSGCTELALPKLKNEEVWELLEKEASSNEMD